MVPSGSVSNRQVECFCLPVCLGVALVASLQKSGKWTVPVVEAKQAMPWNADTSGINPFKHAASDRYSLSFLPKTPLTISIRFRRTIGIGGTCTTAFPYLQY